MTRVLLFLVAGLAGCATCGDFTYRGYTVDEHCGSVYGTQGRWFRGDGVVELTLGASNPLTQTGITWGRYEPTLRVAFVDDYLIAGSEVPEADLATRCQWAEVPRAGAGGDVIAHDAPATYAEVTVRGRGFNPDLNPLDRDRYQRFSWHFECFDGEIASIATDVVALVVVDGNSPWPQLREQAE